MPATQFTELMAVSPRDTDTNDKTRAQQLLKWTTVLATIDIGRKVPGSCAPFRVRELGLHVTQCRLAQA